MNQLAPWDNSAAVAQIDALIAKVDSLRVRRVHKPNWTYGGHPPEPKPYDTIRRYLREEAIADDCNFSAGISLVICAALVALLLVNPQ